VPGAGDTPTAAPKVDSSANDAAAAPADAKPEQTLEQCAAGYLLEADTLGSDPPLEFLCGDRDLRNITLNLGVVITRSAGGRPLPYLKEWVNLGWYQLVAAGLLRVRCCSDDQRELRLPEPRGDACEPLDPGIERLVAENLTGSQIETLTDELYHDILCFYARGVPRPYPFKTHPKAYQTRTLRTFLSRANGLEPKGETLP
jgi:hypothetical protein